jgi:protein-disulfide isomerase
VAQPERVAGAPAIDLNRHSYGSSDAPHTVVEYGDFECPYCAAAAPVLHRLVDTSEASVRLVFRHFPLFQVHPFALTAALAAEAAGDRFWQLHDVLFQNQKHLTDADLDRYAAELGAGAVTGEAAQRFRPAVEADYEQGVADGARGTPTLFIDGRHYTGKVEITALQQALDLCD